MNTCKFHGSHVIFKLVHVTQCNNTNLRYSLFGPPRSSPSSPLKITLNSRVGLKVLLVATLIVDARMASLWTMMVGLDAGSGSVTVRLAHLARTLFNVSSGLKHVNTVYLLQSYVHDVYVFVYYNVILYNGGS